MGISSRNRNRVLAGAATVVLFGSGSQAAIAAGSGGVVGGVLNTTTGVVSTALDTTLGLLTGADWGYSSTQTSMQQVQNQIGASTLYGRGLTGKSVGVALIDTGVVPVQGLTSGNVVNGPDLSLDGQGPGASYLDGFGHGTHMAGIIAGNDGTAGGFTGVAPGATLVNVRVGADDGSVDVSQIIAGIDWVIAHHNDAGVNIRVINLSYGTNSTQSYKTDPLDRAVEDAWKAGIVVVTSGGNQGAKQPSLDDPADDPYVLSVGAADTSGGVPALSTIPSFSSRGSSSRHVDLVAPGQSIVSLRDPGSDVDTEYPGARVGTRFFKGSGTSQAAAVVSGAVALMLQARPTLTPNQVKYLLTSTATPLLLGGNASARGAGLLNIAAATLSPTPKAAASNQTFASSTGLGTLQGARGTDVVETNGVPLTGEKDILGGKWTPATWAPKSAAGTAWSKGTFNGKTWAGTGWTGSSWASKTWARATWTGADWSGASWSSHSWSGASWSSHSWSGATWSSHSWSDASWSSHSWS